MREGIFGTGRAIRSHQERRHRQWGNEKIWRDEVQVGGTLSSKFIRNRTKITARDLEVEQDISFSTVEIFCRGRADRVMGGYLIAGNGFEVNKLGVPGGTVTKVEIGADLGKHEHLKDLEERLPIREHFLQDLKRRYDFRQVQRLESERNRYIQERRERGETHPEISGVAKSLEEKIRQRRAELEQLRVQIETTEKVLADEREERDRLVVDFKESFKAELVVKDVIYPGVVVLMKGSTHENHHELRGVRFYFKEDQLVYDYIVRPSLKLRRPLRRQ